MEYKKNLYIYFIISYSVLFFSTVIGGYYLTKAYGISDEISSYIYNYSESLKSGMNMWGIVKSSMLTYLVIVIVIHITSYFSHGYIFSYLICAREGFVNGFTITAIIMTDNLNRCPILVTYLPKAFIVIPFLAVFVSVSMVFSKNRQYMDRKLKIIYIIFSVALFTIFCVSCVLEGFTTTIFAKWLLLKVT